MTDHYAVVGNPVAHSVSPQIYAEFARQTGQDLDYVRLLAPRDAFNATVMKFRAENGKGMSVTLPFKMEAYQLANVRSERAEQARAVNMLKFDSEEIFGDNTDGVGLVRDIETNLRFTIAGKRVLLMGAGGAARGALPPLFEKKPAALVIANRTLHRANLLQQYAEKWGKCAVSAYPDLAGLRFDLVINATAASIGGEVPPLPDDIFATGAFAYDMMYGQEPTPFLKFAQAHGAARVADGLGMLIEQAAESFLMWRGKRPHTAPVIAMLRAQGKQ